VRSGQNGLCSNDFRLHDLQSPLSIIEGYIDLLKEVGPLNAQQSQFVGRIKVATANMNQLITDLLDLGKIEVGLEMEMMPCDLERHHRPGRQRPERVG
jgi:signal transduction histidine kinase